MLLFRFEVAPFPFFDAEAFASYDLPEEEEGTDFNSKSLRGLEKEMLEGMIGAKSDDQVGGKDSPVFIDKKMTHPLRYQISF